MANTVIALKKSATPAAQPSALANGELAINFADGKLFYKHANGTILPFNTTGGNAYGTVNANGTLIVAGTSSDVFSLVAGNNITISGDAVNDRIIINSTGGASVNIGDNPPVTPTPVSGDLWWSSSQGTLLIYYNDGSSSQWVEAVSGSMYANVAEQIAIAGFNKANNALANSTGTFSGNLTITGTLTVGSNTVNITSNSISIGGINVEASIASSFDKANSANVLAFNTGTGANTFASATISGANSAVGTGANTVGSAAFSKANNALANSSTVFAGDLTITGNLTVSSNTVSVNGQNVSPVQSFRNKIINGNFDHWQRGTSVTGVGNGQYLADRWYSFRVGTTANVSRQAFTLGQTDVPGEPTYFHRSVVSSVAGAGSRFDIRQNIESVRTFAGQTATLSFWAKADASKNMAVEFVQIFGTGGSPSSTVTAIGVTTCALTTAWKKFTITVNIPSISGKTLGTDNNDSLLIAFWFDAGSDFNSRTNSLGQQSGTFDIAQVQLEAGPVATPFEMRPIGTELALCQRYYQAASTFIYSGSFARICYMFPVPMRAAPTLAGGGAGFNSTNLTAAGFCADQTTGAIQSMTYSAEL